MKRLLNSFGKFLTDNIAFVVIAVVFLVCSVFIAVGTKSDDGSITLNGKNAKYSQAQEDAMCALANKRDAAISELAGINVPQDAGSGCEPTELAQMGSLPYYSVDVSSPTAFYNAVNGKGFNEGYGMQCVAGFKQFMYALSGKYVATKTGGANGYAQQQSQIEPLGFTWHSGKSGLQNGDWGIFGGGQYGHVSMYYQGKWFGQNQGAANANVGNAFNLIGLGTGDLIGFYRPNIYIAQQPAAENPTVSTTPEATNTYTVQRGDTLGGISLRMGWWPGVAGLYGDTGYTQRLADHNDIKWRGSINPGQSIDRAE